jgi:proton glutamate symport protein
MDMARTCTNVIGNCLACIVIAKWEGVYNDKLIHESAREITTKDNGTKD